LLSIYLTSSLTSMPNTVIPKSWKTILRWVL